MYDSDFNFVDAERKTDMQVWYVEGVAVPALKGTDIS